MRADGGQQEELYNTNIPEKMFYKIREVAKIADVKPHVLRYWESEFSILKPSKNKNGQRTYTKKDIDTILQIKQLLHVERYSIAGAKKLLRRKKDEPEKNRSDCGGSTELLEEIKTELVDILDSLLEPT